MPIHVVRLSGEIDMQRSAELAAVATGFEQSGASDVELDLSGVTFFDSTGCAMIARLLRTARSRGGRVVVRNPRPAIWRVLTITGLAPLVTLQTSSAGPPPPAHNGPVMNVPRQTREDLPLRRSWSL